MIQVDFYLPVRRGHSGTRHPVTAIQLLERYLEEMGGFTFHGIVQGSWVDPESGEPVREQSFHYSIAVPRSQVNLLRAFLRDRAKVLFDQETIYFSVAGRVEFL